MGRKLIPGKRQQKDAALFNRCPSTLCFIGFVGEQGEGKRERDRTHLQQMVVAIDIAVSEAFLLYRDSGAKIKDVQLVYVA